MTVGPARPGFADHLPEIDQVVGDHPDADPALRRQGGGPMNQARRLAGASWIKRLVPVGLALCGGLASEQTAMQA
jgi:hypothetical protein